MKLACNYAVVRFLPYAATEEFVNVGVVLHCAATAYLDFRLAKKWSRVTEFFPELDTALYRNALQMFRLDLGSLKEATGTNHPQQLVMEDTIGGYDTIFRELVRPRESLFRSAAFVPYLRKIRTRSWMSFIISTWKGSLPANGNTRKR